MALAALIADESLRALMIAAPRFCTHAIRSPRNQAVSSAEGSASPTGVPAIVARDASGNCVLEWLPQMTACRTSSSRAPARSASCELRRLWSRRVSAVTFCAGIVGAALRARIAAFVFAGLPTTRTLHVGLPTRASDLPASAKMWQFFLSRSARSMPSLRGNAPSITATSAPVNAVSWSSVVSTRPSVGRRRSSSSSLTPPSASSAGVTSSRCRLTLTRAPKMVPSSRRGSSE
mmetsp:Transcript_14372/g.44861  ORF Transcript_14372/g.44861 Transcript_14372/m.44861 type:complete len:233 (-) Transcript_14372:104-802(-)